MIVIKKIILIVCLVCCLCGCSFLTDKSNITSLLSAPKLSKNESEIVAAIEDYLGEAITLKYSKTQGYSAPIQLIDINYDGIYEAAVFYYAPNKGTNIRFALLSHSHDKWKIYMDKEGLGTEVFYFDTIVLPKVYGKQITVGYKSANIEENFFVTYFTDEEMKLPDFVERCQKIVDGDVSGGGFSDIVLTKAAYGENISVNVLSFTDKMTFKNIGSRALRYPAEYISQLIINPIESGGNAIYIDYRDGQNRTHTEVYKIEGERLISAVEGGIVSKMWEYDRPLNSRDIDGDGFIEIPTVIQPARPQEMPSFKYMEWADWTKKEIKRKYYGIVYVNENIFIALPDHWQNVVYANALENGFEVVSAEDGQQLFSFTEVGKDDAADRNGYSYVIHIGTKLWNLKCSETLDIPQAEYIYKSITDLD